MNFSDNYLAFTQASYSDSLKAIQEAANRILELQNEQLQAVVKNAIAPMQSMLDEAARNIFSNLDISKQLSASIGVMKQTISQFSDIIPDENSSTSSNSESNDVSNVQDDICNNIENLISEVPIDPKAKEDIISSNEIRSLRTTNPWTREQKFQLITLILSILTFLLSIISNRLKNFTTYKIKCKIFLKLLPNPKMRKNPLLLMMNLYLNLSDFHF